jgi:hypothetical protein
LVFLFLLVFVQEQFEIKAKRKTRRKPSQSHVAFVYDVLGEE